MTESRNPQMTRTGTDRVDQDGWGATTRTEGAAKAQAATSTPGGGLAAKLSGAVKGATKVTESEPKAKKGRPAAGRQPRRARLTLSHLNVYSVFKFACVLAIALFFVWLIVVGVLYGILDVAGALDKINSTVKTINGDDSKPVVTGGVVFGAAVIIGAANIVLFIALSTVGAMVYNLCADLVGGVEVTLSERE